MLRRNTRLRRGYLYRKSLEGKERQHYEKKRRLRQALEEGKPIPTELCNQDHALRREIDLDDQERAGQLPLSRSVAFGFPLSLCLGLLTCGYWRFR
ncbi:hypothetical protein GUJ93_ZPchr0008g11735 [Zizania palustris]|uniref:Uncharacterized protein n=1 Tax=Zizania palustris TaxID=103762 RepID=A0A8J5VJF7_ZIZPA|nr:hypothetical protein GUJ93_ZPchr0008g11735 [Zizania palustris]KAG8046520.1 hypothetical protein GUJ93_ZPchr0008g11735 [Zizania palustris]KAG8046522.1 hypothetical protein GUJ93_ZPchr0008g11735 [Zizania palustris]